MSIATGTTNVDVVGDLTAASFEPDGDTAAGDDAAIGYTAGEGIIITGQGSSTDVTIKNDADATVMSIATGTTQATFAGEVVAASLDISGNIDVDGTTNLDAVDIDGAIDIAGASTFNNKIIINSSAEDAGHTNAIPLTNHATFIQTGGAETSTLGAGTEGQIKVIVMETAVGNMVTTVTNAAWGGSSTITFDAVGDAVTLQYIDSKWYCIGNNGAVFG